MNQANNDAFYLHEKALPINVNLIFQVSHFSFVSKKNLNLIPLLPQQMATDLA